MSRPAPPSGPISWCAPVEPGAAGPAPRGRSTAVLRRRAIKLFLGSAVPPIFNRPELLFETSDLAALAVPARCSSCHARYARQKVQLAHRACGERQRLRGAAPRSARTGAGWSFSSNRSVSNSTAPTIMLVRQRTTARGGQPYADQFDALGQQMSIRRCVHVGGATRRIGALAGGAARMYLDHLPRSRSEKSLMEDSVNYRTPSRGYRRSIEGSTCIRRQSRASKPISSSISRVVADFRDQQPMPRSRCRASSKNANAATEVSPCAKSWSGRRSAPGNSG